MKAKHFLFFSLFLLVIITSCSETSNEQLFDSSLLEKRSAEEVEKVIEDFILAEDSTTIKNW